jgi:ABC-type antimicrobial peptide transport system permease subunit
VSTYLYKTPTYDPWAWGAATAALLAVALVGALVPARRAARVNPVQALNAE